jgi:rare lipoprotein A (peptidoglycan hydrolase)
LSSATFFNTRLDNYKDSKNTTEFFSKRDTLARETPRTLDIEIYYGKPGIFDLADMLNSQNIIVFPEDIVQAFPDPLLGIGSRITIVRAMPIAVFDANNQTIYRTFQSTVAELLEEKGIVLGEQDRIEPAISTLLTKNLEIKITRVSETELTEKVYLDFKIIKKEDPNLERGKSYITQKGEKGLKEMVYKVKRENGVEVSRILLEERLVKNPKDQIVVYGTKVVVLGQGYATWYTKRLSMIAACNFLPRGTKIRVVNLANGKSVVVTVVGGGIQTPGVIVDLSYDAFSILANPNQGVIRVRIEKE